MRAIILNPKGLIRGQNYMTIIMNERKTGSLQSSCSQ